MAFKITGLSVTTTYKMMHRLFSSTAVRRDLIAVQNNDGLRTITLNDMKTRNALSLRMMEELIEAINIDKESADLRSIVIQAATGPVFSAGHNLKELTSDQGIENQQKVFMTCGQLMMSIQKAEVPIIAVVNGLAAAAGCQLVASCDIAVASENSKFSTPGANFGVFCSTPGVSVSRKANRSTAAYMVFTGLPITASEALQAGLVSRVVHQDKLDQTVSEIYNSIKSKSRPIVKLGKDFFYRQLEMPYAEALTQGGEIMVKNLQLKDSQEGLLSFKEKRKPSWTHEN